MKPTSDTRKPYSGQRRSLVLAVDIGTTFSGVSYAILEPGEVPKIHGVTRFPGQEHVAGNSKIPSIMYYDQDGNMKAAGAEADGASVLAQAEDEGWIKTELFKLRLRPKTMTLKMNGMRLSPLPRGKTAVDVFGDFLSYLFRCTHSFIVDTHANGHALWRAVENDIQFVLSHPNGWEGAQQTKMRRAATLGGLIPDTDEGKSRIRFVTEGEASLHACVLNGLAADVLSNPSGHGFVVADAGGGTLDISSYAIRGTAPLVIEEVAPPDCVFAGSVFVSRRARQFFEEKLHDSMYGSADSLDHITKRFDETTKRLFRDSKELQFVPFGSPLDKDLAMGIRGGQLRLTGEEVAALFEPSIEAAITSIKAQMDSSSSQIKSVWLVGGFAASPWLFAQLQERLKPLGVTVSRPDSQTSKAVADGAIGFYCDHHVSARMSKFMYGVEYLRNFDPNDAEHTARQHRLFEMPSGPKLLPDAFDCILARGLKVKESTVFSRKYCTEVTSLSTLSVFEVEIWCFRGGDDIPKWILRNHEHFSTLCYVRADLSPLASSAQPKEGKNGKMYWNIVFSIEIHFGLTEFRARIKWVDNGHVKYGPASIVYNEMGHRAEEEEDDFAPDDESAYARSARPHSVASSRAASIAPASSRDSVVVQSRAVSRAASVAHSPLPPAAELQPPISHTPSVAPTPARHRTVTNVSSHPSESERRHSGHASRPESVRDSRRSSVIVDRPRDSERSIGLVTPRAPDVMDRSVNFSVRSTDSRVSGRTDASTRLREELTAVWGPATSASQQQTPSASPRGEAASYFDMTSRGVDELEYLTPPAATSRAATQAAASKPGTPPVASKVATPAIASRSLTPPEASKPVTPPAASKAPTPPARSGAATQASATITDRALSSKVASKAPSKVATPVASPKASTPVALSKVPTPVATPKIASKVPTPAATPKIASKVPTPVVTPKVASKVPSPVATPKGPTSGAATPKASSTGEVLAASISRALSPVASPRPSTPTILETLANLGSKLVTPAATTPKENSKAPSRAVSKAPTPKAATPKAVSQAPSPKTNAPSLLEAPIEEPSKPSTSVESAPALREGQVVLLEPELSQAPAQIEPIGDASIPGGFDDWTDLKDTENPLDGFTGGEHKSGDGIADLWSTDNKPESDAQGFSDFLTHDPQWGAGAGSGSTPKRTSGFGSGITSSAWGLGTGLASTVGSGLSSFGSKTGGTKGSWSMGALGGTFGFGSSQSPSASATADRPKTPENKDALTLDIPPVKVESSATDAGTATAEQKLGPSVPATPATPSTPATPGTKKGKKKSKKNAIAESYFDQGNTGESEASKQAEEAAKKLEEEAAKKAAEDEAAKKAAEDEAAKKAAEDEAAKKVAEEEAAKKVAEEDAAKKVAEDEAVKKAEEDAAAAQRAEEEAAAAKKAEDEATAIKEAEQAAAAQMAEDKAAAQKAEEEAKKAEDETVLKQAEEEETAAKQAEEEAASQKAEEAEAAKKVEEETANQANENIAPEAPAAEVTPKDDAGDREGEASAEDLQKDLEGLLDAQGADDKGENDGNDDWLGGSKKKKAKKGGSGAASVAPDSMSREASASGGGNTGGGKKKKGKKGR